MNINIISYLRIKIQKMEKAKLLNMAVVEKKISRYFGKYMTINRTKNFLCSSELYFSNYEKFNDPFEFSSILEDLCTTDKKLIFYKQIGVPDLLLNDAILNGDSIIKDAINEVNKEMGVLCGTNNENNLLMWAHYADSHKGTFLLFDISKDPDVFFYPQKVIYDNDVIHLDYIKEQLGNRENLIKLLFHKSKDWEYEKEIRIVDMKYNGPKKVKKDALAKIIFGCRTSDSDIIDIEKACKNHKFNNVRFYKAEKDKQKYQLDVTPL